VIEDCGANDECKAFASAFDGRVFDIEYTEKGFGVPVAWR